VSPPPAQPAARPAPPRRPAFPRFRDLTEAALQRDLHVHTSRTDGQADAEAILARAEERGLRCVAFTEHVRRDSGWFGEFADDVRRRARAHPRLEVLVGCEAKALDARGALDASGEILDACEIVLGSVHRFAREGGGFLDAAAMSREELAEREHEWALGLVRSPRVDVLAHPGGMYARRHGADLPEPLMSTLVDEARARGVAVEINASYLKDADRMLALLDELNPYVSLGSDVHALDDLGRCRDLLLAWRRRAR
jgi:putative hydrolase